MKAAQIFAMLLLAAPTAAEIKAVRYPKATEGETIGERAFPPTGGTREWNRQAHYYGAGDPCANMQKQACLDNNLCVYMKGDRHDRRNGRESLGPNSGKVGHHSGTKRMRNGVMLTIESCAMVHMAQRDQASKFEKKGLEELGFGTSWDTMKCEEAFFLKDCKDMNQHAGKNVQGTACAWHCDTGCTDYTGDEKRVYMECGWDTKQVVAAAEEEEDEEEEQTCLKIDGSDNQACGEGACGASPDCCNFSPSCPAMVCIDSTVCMGAA